MSGQQIKLAVKDLTPYSRGMTIIAVIKRLTPVHYRKKSSFFYCTVSDQTGSMKCVCFDSSVYSKIIVSYLIYVFILFILIATFVSFGGILLTVFMI